MNRRDFLAKLGIGVVGAVTGIPALGDERFGVSGDYIPTPKPEDYVITGDGWIRAVFDGESPAKFFTSLDGEDWSEIAGAPLRLEVSDGTEPLDIQANVSVDNWDEIDGEIDIIEKREHGETVYKLSLEAENKGATPQQAMIHGVKVYNGAGYLTINAEFGN